jgi:hypothetical protein
VRTRGAVRTSHSADPPSTDIRNTVEIDLKDLAGKSSQIAVAVPERSEQMSSSLGLLDAASGAVRFVDLPPGEYMVVIEPAQETRKGENP